MDDLSGIFAFLMANKLIVGVVVVALYYFRDKLWEGLNKLGIKGKPNPSPTLTGPTPSNLADLIPWLLAKIEEGRARNNEVIVQQVIEALPVAQSFQSLPSEVKVTQTEGGVNIKSPNIDLTIPTAVKAAAIAVFSLLALSMPCVAQCPPGEKTQAVAADSKWLTDYDAAAKKAKAEDKRVFVYFTMDECPHCRTMERHLADCDVARAMDRQFVFVKLSNRHQLFRQFELRVCPSALWGRPGGEPVKYRGVMDKKFLLELFGPPSKLPG